MRPLGCWPRDTRCTARPRRSCPHGTRTPRHTAHYVLVPEHDAGLLDAWYRLGFGQQHAHGIREVPQVAPRPAAVLIRPASRSDIDALARLDLALRENRAL